jgi:flagellar basal body-associated protein FliL
MSKEGDKDYYRINDGETKEDEGDSEMTTGSKRSKKKIIIIISCIVVVSVAVAVLLLILLLKKSGKIPSGYNGFVQKESTNLYYGYHAKLAREKDVKYPIEFGENNKEFTDVDFFI